MIEKFFKTDAIGKVGQRSDGIWYCKEVDFKNRKDLETKLGWINEVLNNVNAEKEKENKEKKKQGVNK